MTDDFEDRLRADLHGLADGTEPSPWMWSRIDARLRTPVRRSWSLLVTYSLALLMAGFTALEVTVFQAGASHHPAHDRSVGAIAVSASTTLDVPPRPSAQLAMAPPDRGGSARPSTGEPKTEPLAAPTSKATVTTASSRRPSVAQPPPPTTASVPRSSTTAPPGVPSPPRNVLARAGDASATVSWQAPSSPGASEIAGYVVSGGGEPVLVPADQLSITLEDLVNDETYVFTVRAFSAAGDGTESAPSAPVTPRRESSVDGEAETEARDQEK